MSYVGQKCRVALPSSPDAVERVEQLAREVLTERCAAVGCVPGDVTLAWRGTVEEARASEWAFTVPDGTPADWVIFVYDTIAAAPEG